MVLRDLLADAHARRHQARRVEGGLGLRHLVTTSPPPISATCP